MNPKCGKKSEQFFFMNIPIYVMIFEVSQIEIFLLTLFCHRNRLLTIILCFLLFLLQRLRTQLDTKRPIIEQSLEAGRFYLREEGDDTRLSTSSNDSNDQGKLNNQSMIRV